jgi:hypothetical protein
MAGGSLIPEYYNSKLNFCMFWAPPASLHHNPSKFLQTLARPHVMAGIIEFAEFTGNYNIIPHNPKPHWSFCSFLGGALCTWGMSFFIDKDAGIDYHDRYDMIMSNLPSGAGYKNYAHYGQCL